MLIAVFYVIRVPHISVPMLISEFYLGMSAANLSLLTSVFYLGMSAVNLSLLTSVFYLGRSDA